MAAGVALALLERLEDQRLFLGAHAAEAANPAVGGRALEIVERADVELAVQRRHRLRSDALQMQQIEHRRRELRDQLAVIGGICRSR